MIHLKIALLTLFLSLSTSLKFTILVNRADGAQCFYQALTTNEKYHFQVFSKTHQNYRMDVMLSATNNKWEEVVIKVADSVVESISKYAPQEGTYMFCISSTDDSVLRATVTIMSGLEMANLEYLPSNNDQENLHREIDWLDGQKKKLFEVLNRIEGDRYTAENLKSMMSVKYIVFAVLGLGAVIGVNVVLYNQTKKTLKDRKLI